MKLYGEGEYNLNAIKEIKVSDSFLSLGKDTIDCQRDESLYGCSTKHYLDTILDQCGCLPLNLRITNKVSKNIFLF